MPRPPLRPLPQQGEPLAPPSIALGFFGLALLWLGAGGLGVVLVSDELARGNVLAPRVIAVTHAFTLGLLSQAIFGALHQFLPAVTGSPIRHPRIAKSAPALFTVGLGLLIAGLWLWRPSWQAAGWVALFVAVGAGSLNTLPARRRATRNRYVGGFVSLSHSALGFAMVIAAIRIGEGLGWWQLDRTGLLSLHFHLGALGFGTLTATAFGSKMLPAFLGAQVDDGSRIRAVAWSASLGLLALALALVIRSEWIQWIARIAMAAGAVTQLWLLVDYFRLRTPGRIDPGLGLVGVAIAGLAATIVAGGVVALAAPAPGRWWATYVFLAVVGWLGALILGVMHRVAPRIVVLWLAEARRSLSPAAQRAELLHAPLGWATAATAALAIATTAIGIAAGIAPLIRAGGAAIALTAALAGLQAAHLARSAVSVGTRRSHE